MKVSKKILGKGMLMTSLLIAIIATTGIYVEVKANQLDYSTGSEEMHYDVETHEYYFYQLTSEVDKKNYRRIQEAFMNLDKKVKLKEVYTFDKIQTLIFFVLNDHPEIFWFDNCTNSKVYLSGDGSTELKYTMTKEEIAKAQYEIDMFEMDVIASSIKRNMTDYEREIAIYNYISKHATFDIVHESKDKDYSQSIYSVVKGQTVCRGYSLMFKYLCNKYNIPCIVVAGRTEPNTATNNKTINHGWNEVMIDGKWYVVDLTDSRCSVYKGKFFDTTFYKFNMTTKCLQNFASINKGAIVPECTSTKYDYYNQNNRYFEEANLDKFKQLIYEQDKAKLNQQHYLAIRCANEKVFNKMLKIIDTEDIGIWREELNRDIYIRDTYENSNLYIIKVEW